MSFDNLLTSQNGKCAACNQDFKPYEPHEDLCRITGSLRGLVCTNCNAIIGMAHELGVKSVRKVIAYLDNYWMKRALG